MGVDGKQVIALKLKEGEDGVQGLGQDKELVPLLWQPLPLGGEGR